MHLQSYFISTW